MFFRGRCGVSVTGSQVRELNGVVIAPMFEKEKTRCNFIIMVALAFAQTIWWRIELGLFRDYD